jgi:hypothetical protein
MGLMNELKAAEAGFEIVAEYPQFIHLPIILSEAAVMLWDYHDDDLSAPGAQMQVTIAGIPAGI